MRTTLRLDDNLLAAAKQLAVSTGRTLTAVIEDALREVLARRSRMGGAEEIRFTIVGGEGDEHGLRPGVDLDDSVALLELMEGDALNRR